MFESAKIRICPGFYTPAIPRYAIYLSENINFKKIQSIYCISRNYIYLCSPIRGYSSVG